MCAACVFILTMVLSAVTELSGEHPRFPPPQKDEDWNQQARATLQRALSLSQNLNVAKNVVLLLGDGMSIPTITAARIYQGQTKRQHSGEEGQLYFERFPHVALSKTYNVDHQVPDSAATATAFLCGVKTNDKIVGLNQKVPEGDCAKQAGNELTSLLDWSLAEGKSVGLVTTTRVTHATPAALYAHAAQRDWESDSDLPASARGRCDDIALQLVKDNPRVQVILGGGRRNFLPVGMADPEHVNKTGSRKDGRNLINEWMSDKRRRGLRHRYVWNQTEFANIEPNNIDYLLGLFEHGHMQYEFQRSEDSAGEPSITEMAEVAVRILQKNPKGFFLLVEGGRIDHGHHVGSAKLALSETLAFSLAAEKVAEMTSDTDTLLVVTADHSHTMTLGGYPKRGNPIFGFADEEKSTDALPYTSLAYANGPGYEIDASTGKRPDLTSVDTESFNFRQQSAVPVALESHGGDDVAIYARGPMAHLFHGVVEQNYIAHALAYASCVGQNKEHCKPGVKHGIVNYYVFSTASNITCNVFVYVFIALYHIVKYTNFAQ